MGYEVESHLWGKGEDVPCAQDGVFGETRVGKEGSSPWDKDVPHAWHGSQEVTLPEVSVPGPDQTCPLTSVVIPRQRCPMAGPRGAWQWPHVGEGAPRRRRAAADSNSETVQSPIK